MTESQDVQAIVTIEKLIQEATSSTLLQPDLEKFDRITQLICRNENMNCIKTIKKRLEFKNPKTQLYTLELIEFVTCAGDEVFHTEIHKKEFLQSIHVIFNQKGIMNLQIRV